MSKKKKVKSGSLKVTAYMVLLAGSAFYINHYIKVNKPTNEFSKFKLEQPVDDEYYYNPVDIYNITLDYIASSTARVFSKISFDVLKKVPTEDEQEKSLIIKENEIVENNMDEEKELYNVNMDEERENFTDDLLNFLAPKPINPKENISSELIEQGYKFSRIDFESLAEINEDVRGWLTIDGTIIDYPVMQSVDNEYYLHHDIYGKSSQTGMIFQDCRNQTLENMEDDLSDITILYGHHMKNGSMFAELCKYKKQDFVDKHPFGIFYSTDGYAYKISFFAGQIISGKSDTILFREDFETEEEFMTYIDDLRNNSMFTSDVEVNPHDKIMAMVTCTYEAKNSRFVLYGKLEKQYVNRRQMIKEEKMR